MGKTKVKESKKPLTLSKVVVYILLILLAITIIIPVGWVFVASVKQNSEFYGSPWVLPEKIYFQNFIDAGNRAGGRPSGCSGLRLWPTFCGTPWLIGQNKGETGPR